MVTDVRSLRVASSEFRRREHVHLVAVRPVDQERGLPELIGGAAQFDWDIPNDGLTVLLRLGDKDFLQGYGHLYHGKLRERVPLVDERIVAIREDWIK